MHCITMPALPDHALSTMRIWTLAQVCPHLELNQKLNLALIYPAPDMTRAAKGLRESLDYCRAPDTQCRSWHWLPTSIGPIL